MRNGLDMLAREAYERRRERVLELTKDTDVAPQSQNGSMFSRITKYFSCLFVKKK